MCGLLDRVFSLYCSHFLSCHAGTALSKIKRNYLDVPSRRTSQLRSLGDELHGVQRIMFDNVDAVLQRGEMISGNTPNCKGMTINHCFFFQYCHYLLP